MATKQQEEAALDALIASFFHISSEDDLPEVDVSILDDADRAALDALGDDLVDRLLAQREAAKVDIPPDVIAELEQHRRDLIADEELDDAEPQP